jgi:hypothetical protein
MPRRSFLNNLSHGQIVTPAPAIDPRNARIAALEAQNASLRARVAQLQSPSAPEHLIAVTKILWMESQELKKSESPFRLSAGKTDQQAEEVLNFEPLERSARFKAMAPTWYHLVMRGCFSRNPEDGCALRASEDARTPDFFKRGAYFGMSASTVGPQRSHGIGYAQHYR